MNTFDILVFICVIAAVSGVSPTLISIFTSLLGGTLGKGHGNAKIWYNSLSFFIGFVATIMVIGSSFWLLLDALNGHLALYVCVVVAAIAIGAAIIEIKDYFWYGRGISHKPYKRLSSALHTRTSTKFGFFSSFTLGVIAVAATASNIGLVTITAASLLYVSNAAPSVAWFVLFGIFLLAGAFFSLLALIIGTKISAIVRWKEESKAVMRLGSGLGLVAVAWLILLFISHVITVVQ